MYYKPVFTTFFIWIFCSCHRQPAADIIYLNAAIWTGDSANPEAKAIAVKDSVILYVGNEYQSYAGSHTIQTDLKGKMLVPGIIDKPVHIRDTKVVLTVVNGKQAYAAPGYFLKNPAASVIPGQ